MRKFERSALCLLIEMRGTSMRNHAIPRVRARLAPGVLDCALIHPAGQLKDGRMLVYALKGKVIAPCERNGRRKSDDTGGRARRDSPKALT